MQFWIFDRSGPYSSTELDVHEQPKKFAQAIASYLIMIIMTDLELGFGPLVEHHGNDQYITVSESQGGAKRDFNFILTLLRSSRQSYAGVQAATAQNSLALNHGSTL